MLPRKGPRGVRTFAAEPGLGKFPLPELRGSLLRCQDALRPFARTAEDWARVQTDVVRALEELAPVQARLEDRFARTDNYVHGDWWSDFAYLEERNPITPIESTPLDFGGSLPPTLRAALWLRNAAAVHDALFRETFPVCGFSPTQPITMEQFKSLYETCRVPRPGMDQQLRLFRTESEVGGKRTAPREAILGVNGRMYAIQLDSALDPATTPLTAGAIQVAVDAAVRHAYSTPFAANELRDVGVFTAGSRDRWAEAYELLLRENFAVLDRIQKALCVLTLDDSMPDQLEELQRELALPKRPGSRFFDKASQFVVFRNGKAGSSMEHSVMDVAAQLLTHELCEEMNMEWLQRARASGVGPEEFARREASATIPGASHTFLSWTRVPSPVFVLLAEAQREYDDRLRTSQWKLSMTRFNGVGRHVFKAAGVSSDSFVQMAFQATYMKLHGRIPSTYESVGVLRFRKGRTETGRCVSTASQRFLETWMAYGADNSSSLHVLGGELRKACEVHERYIRSTIQGDQGFDRHLFALRCQCREMGLPLPALFSNDVYVRASRWDLSTSNAFIGGTLQKQSGGTCFRPVGDDSVGIVYAIFPDCIDLTIMSQRPEFDSGVFLRELSSTIGVLYRAISPQSRPPAPSALLHPGGNPNHKL